MAPPHATPPPPVPDHWLGYVAADASGANAAELSWQAYFRDPVLQRLIETALVNNRDLRVAALRAEEARAAFRIQRADQFPGFGIDAQSARARVPGDLSATGQSVVAGEYRAEVGLSSWELDLWGRVRNLKESALQSWLATDAGRRAAELALIGQVGDGYLGLRELDERVALARRTVQTREESYRIFSRRHEVGATSKLELTQVQTLLTQAQALLAQLGVEQRLPFIPVFPAGNMFWARTEAIAPMFALDFEAFPSEQGQQDGTIAHTIERCWPIVARSRGFSVLRVCRPSRGPGYGGRHSAMKRRLAHQAKDVV